MKKEAQLFAHPFIFILTLVVVALILVWGFRVILDLKKQAELSELAVFVNDLKNDVKAYYYFDVGSSKQLNLNLPYKIKELCFFNPKDPITAEINLELETLLLDNPEYNFYVLPLDSYSLTNFKIPYLKVNSTKNPLCLKVFRKLDAVIETKENYVEIKPAEE